MKILGIIPARYASTRLSGKPLIDINGKSMIERVFLQVKKCIHVSKVIVATDDLRISNHVEAFGGEAIMTSEAHPSGTDRCYEAFSKLKEDYDFIINIQGDEPFIKPEQIEALISCLEMDTQIATLGKKIDSIETLFNPSIPKVIFNSENTCIYFSRHPIPYFRGKSQEEWLLFHEYYKHIGIYAYRKDILSEITQLNPSALEKAESLEQLRWLENGFKIKIAFTEMETLGIDTLEDLQKINEFLKDEEKKSY